MKHKLFLVYIFSTIAYQSYSNQTPPANFKAYYYNLQVEPSFDSKSISGFNDIHFTIQFQGKSIEVDLASQFIIDSIVFQNQHLIYTKNKDKILIEFPQLLEKENQYAIRIYYHGKPKEAINPPWDGGFVWQRDSLNQPWIGVACEGIGAKSWWPCQDNWSLEPDSMRVTIVTTQNLSGISNGQMHTKTIIDNKTYSTWIINYPINLYGVSIGVGNYIHFSDTLLRQDGSSLPLDYYVLDYNIDKARKHFAQVPVLLKALEYYFGTYPFPKDGYALIETPYWGMEHQSGIAYGNKYKNNFYDYDYIILHETAHEWWGNNVTANDPGNMWIHEAFATYSESLLAETLYNSKTSLNYLTKQRSKIKNIHPIAGPLGVNYHDHQDTDQYYKGSWLLHTIRKTVDNDSLWFACLKNFQTHYRQQTISREDVASFFNQHLKKDLTPIFNQYLDYTQLPILTFRLAQHKKNKILEIKWQAEAANFSMPIEFTVDKKQYIIMANNLSFTKLEFPSNVSTIEFNTKDYLIEVEKLSQ